ncbi:uncharacterized protein LOC101238613 [Trichonephila clavipes]|nr:uncharacterized protein LOC101238613 [Trichonephila clavipes]
MTKGLGGKNKLTDKLIDRIQNYYGIAIRSNVGNLQKMMSSVIAAFFHCVSGKNNSLHGQCPEGSESWCRYQRAKAAGSPLKEIEQGRPNKIIHQIKPTYLKLCDETLLKKCLHGYTKLLKVLIWSLSSLYDPSRSWIARSAPRNEDDTMTGKPFKSKHRRIGYQMETAPCSTYQQLAEMFKTSDETTIRKHLHRIRKK